MHHKRHQNTTHRHAPRHPNRRFTPPTKQYTTNYTHPLQNKQRTNTKPAITQHNPIEQFNINHHQIHPKTQTRCTNYQRIGHRKHQCKQQSRCVRCAGTSCIPHNCKSATRKCINSGQNHYSSYKNCTVIKKHTGNSFHIRRQNTYADIVAKSNTSLAELRNIHHATHNETSNQISQLNNKINDLGKVIIKPKENLNRHIE